MFKNILKIACFLLLASLAAFSEVSHAQVGVALAPNSLVSIKKLKCGFINGVWIPGTLKKSGIFVPTANQISFLNKRLKNKNLNSTVKTILKAKVKNLRKALRKNSLLCATVGAPSATAVPTAVPTLAPTPVATPAIALPNAVTLAWNVSATSVANDLGGEYLYFCPANPTEGLSAIYGYDIYTSDSPICVAAVHLGLFKRGIGGNVKIRIKGSQGMYIGSIRNSIQSNFFGTFGTSYVFLDLGTNTELITNSVPEITYNQDAAPLYSYLEQTFSFYCGSGIGKIDSIWGTDLYTYDSSICTAAVHAGRISLANGGVVTIQIKPGAAGYVGSSRNGIISSTYGSWGGSFIFVP